MLILGGWEPGAIVRDGNKCGTVLPGHVDHDPAGGELHRVVDQIGKRAGEQVRVAMQRNVIQLRAK